MWIATEEILPEEMQEVLVFDDRKGIFIGHYFNTAKSFIRTSDGVRLTDASHWMSIPEHPKKECNTPEAVLVTCQVVLA